MLAKLTELYLQLSAATKENPVLAGVVSLWGLSVLTYVLRSVPLRFIGFLKVQLTTTLVFNNAGWGTNEIQFNAFNEWYLSSGWARYSRTLSMESIFRKKQQDVLIGPGYGLHFFLLKGRLFWFEKIKLPSAGTSVEKEQITVTCLSRSQKAILDLVDEFKHKENPDKIPVYIYNKDNGWAVTAYLDKRNLDTVVIEKSKKSLLVDKITFFYDTPAWWLDKGLPYKQTFVIHGPPGTGKTSIVKALASYFGRPICILDIRSLNDEQIRDAMHVVPAGAFLLFEDIHAHECLLKKKPIIKENDSSFSLVSMQTLSGVLNALDGIVPLHGVNVFMTTNYLAELDPAITRKGRADYILEIAELTNTEVHEYIRNIYPGFTYDHSLVFKDILGCDIQALFMDNKETPEKFIQELLTIEAEFQDGEYPVDISYSR